MVVPVPVPVPVPELEPDPVPLPVPDWVMRARFGADAAQELWWASARAVPQHLLDVGFAYRYPDLESALAQAAGPASAQG